MKLCDKHWQMLREAIRARNLFHLVSPDSAILEAKMQAAKIEGVKLENFDPLMSANIMITSNAVRVIQGHLHEPWAMSLLFEDKCPICEGSCEQWIEKAADGVLDAVHRLERGEKLPTVEEAEAMAEKEAAEKKTETETEIETDGNPENP